MGKCCRFRFFLVAHYLADPDHGEDGKGQKDNQIKYQRSSRQREVRFRPARGSPLLHPGVGQLGQNGDDDQHQDRDVPRRA